MSHIPYRLIANNQRIAKEINGSIYQKYLWLDNTTLLGFYDKDNNFARFTYAIDRTPPKMDYKGATHYLIYDRLGSLRAVSGANAQRFIKQIDYDSFGNIIRDDNYDATGKLTDSPILDLDIPLGFAGGLYDRHTNLIRFGFRDYDPNTGRWTAKDPIDFNGKQSNLYVYVGNDPVNYIDPSGLAVVCQRALRNSSWQPLLNRDFVRNAGIYHSHIFFDDDSNIGYSADGYFSEPNMDGYDCDPQHYDDDLMRNVLGFVIDIPGSKPGTRKYDTENYDLTDNNCQNFTNDAVGEYNRWIQ